MKRFAISLPLSASQPASPTSQSSSSSTSSFSSIIAEQPSRGVVEEEIVLRALYCITLCLLDRVGTSSFALVQKLCQLIFQSLDQILELSISPSANLRTHAILALQALLLHSTGPTAVKLIDSLLSSAWILWYLYFALEPSDDAIHKMWWSPWSMFTSRLFLSLCSDLNPAAKSLMLRCFPRVFSRSLNVEDARINATSFVSFYQQQPQSATECAELASDSPFFATHQPLTDGTVVPSWVPVSASAVLLPSPPLYLLTSHDAHKRLKRADKELVAQSVWFAVLSGQVKRCNWFEFFKQSSVHKQVSLNH